MGEGLLRIPEAVVAFSDADRAALVSLGAENVVVIAPGVPRLPDITASR